MPDLCISGPQSIQIEVVHAGHISTLRRHCQISCTIKKTLSRADGSYFKLSPRVLAVSFGGYAVSHGTFCTAGQGDKGEQRQPCSQGQAELLELSSQKWLYVTTLSPFAPQPWTFDFYKGNPCSGSNRHGDTGLFKPYKAAQKLRAWGMSFPIRYEPHSAGSSTYIDASLTHVCFFLLSLCNQPLAFPHQEVADAGTVPLWNCPSSREFNIPICTFLAAYTLWGKAMKDVSGNSDEMVLCSHPYLWEVFRISSAEEEDSMTFCFLCLRLHLQWLRLCWLKIISYLHDARVRLAAHRKSTSCNCYVFLLYIFLSVSLARFSDS